ncbi:tetraacyldisaccharide 4'-kinase [Rhodopseudomonas palustris]|uniref:Tetraacyldisaccharide 4'-kinase n=1 Tax=Rhodopseudomonas palustris TaxID=1076 RepID=A0A418UXA0_RHOPL|nr:tetraacyldisaccharide 4'-kinase [Rhodopseudomonas palustris]RJF64960.1 tetraacyldisaccharide 4'-kinase [Rhodopseudomonas palustris]
MREPAFWHRPPSLLSRLLLPLGAIYGEITASRMHKTGLEAGVPVICVGNYHLGGAGKTPTTLALVELLRQLGERPAVLSRGYGGRLHGPIGVDPQRHSAADVGDEPLMMARRVPVVVARDRVDGAALARSQGASVIVMDDGFQNPALVKHLSLIVIDSRRGVGNGSVFPAGPLRAPLRLQIERTDALIIIGDGDAADGIAAEIAARGGPVLRAQLRPDEAALATLKGCRALAFAGIGDPLRFFVTLRNAGIEVVEERAFADHHPFTAADLARLDEDAGRGGLTLVTTEKDLARIGPAATSLRSRILPLPVTLEIETIAPLRTLLLERINQIQARRSDVR